MEFERKIDIFTNRHMPQSRYRRILKTRKDSCKHASTATLQLKTTQKGETDRRIVHTRAHIRHNLMGCNDARGAGVNLLLNLLTNL